MNAELLEVAVEAAREAVAFVRAARPAGRVPAEATKSSPTDVVTAVDTGCERLIRERIAAERPRDGFIGEEGEDTVGSTDVVWVVDPIDGTVNFMYDISWYAVSIAARVGDQVEVGCVVHVASGEEFTAVRAGGAYVRPGPGGSAQRLRVPPSPPLEQALVATGFGYDAERRRLQGNAVARLLPQVRDIRRFGAASLDLCAVASGRVDGYVEQGLKPWDLAAGGLVASEAGARVGGLGAAVAGERLVVCAGPQLFDSLQAAVAECGF